MRAHGMVVVVSGLLFSVCLSTSASSSNTSVGKGQKRASSLSRLRAAHSANPDDPRIAMELGLLLYQQDNSSADAQRLLSMASRRLPKKHDVHLALLDSYLKSGSSTAAAELLQRLQHELDSSDHFAFSATYYLLQHRQISLAQEQWHRIYDRVRVKLEKTAGQNLKPALEKKLRREVGEVLFIQGLLATSAGKKEDAMKFFQRADQHDFPPLDSVQVLMLADSLYELREDRLAAQAYSQFLQHAPEHKQARFHLAVSLYTQRRLTEAKDELERVLRRDPGFLEAHYYLGSALFEMKRYDESRAHFRQELKLDPRCHRCMAKLAHITYLSGDYQQCQAWLEKAAVLDPTWAETNLVYGMLANRTGKYDQAIQHLSKIIEKLPDFTQAHFQLRIAYQRIGDAEKAKEHQDIYNRLIQAEKARTIGKR